MTIQDNVGDSRTPHVALLARLLHRRAVSPFEEQLVLAKQTFLSRRIVLSNREHCLLSPEHGVLLEIPVDVQRA